MKIKKTARQTERNDSFAAFEKRKKNHNNDRFENSQTKRRQKTYQDHRERGFTCIQCSSPVSADREISGVNNRNHCPCCLYSRHVDEYKAGDRKSDCLSRMQPIGLTLKQTHKRYGNALQGELMLIHRCKGCGKISINRIAADDDAARIYELFETSTHHEDQWKSDLENRGIHVLGQADLTAVYSRLFGWQPILEQFETPCTHEMDARVMTQTSEAREG